MELQITIIKPYFLRKSIDVAILGHLNLQKSKRLVNQARKHSPTQKKSAGAISQIKILQFLK